MEFDSFELERLQLKQYILQRAKKLLDEGKNITQAAKLLRGEGLRVTYDQLIKWVRAGQLEDKFKVAQDIAEKLFDQGLEIETITEELQKRGYNYTKQWVGRWISEGAWSQKSDEALSKESIEVVKEIPVLSDDNLIEVLSKISGHSLNETEIAMPDAWIKPIIQSANFTAPILMLTNLLKSPLDSRLQNYFAKRMREREKPRLAVEILEVLAGDVITNPGFDQEIYKNIVETRFTPMQLASNIFGLSEETIKSKISEMRKILEAEQLSYKDVETVQKFPPGTQLEEVLGFLTGKKITKTITKDAAQDAILTGIRSYKLLTLADFIRLLPVPQPWPTEADFKVYEVAWRDMVKDTETERGEQIFLIDKYLLRVSAPNKRTQYDFVERLKLILQDIINNSFMIMPDEINFWNFLFFLLIAAQKAADQKDQPLTRDELADSFGGEKVIPNINGFIDRLHEAKLLLKKLVKGIEYYEVNRATLLKKLNDCKIGYYNAKFWDVPNVSHRVSLFEALRELPGSNEPCICGSKKKFKKCHKDLFT